MVPLADAGATWDLFIVWQQRQNGQPIADLAEGTKPEVSINKPARYRQKRQSGQLCKGKKTTFGGDPPVLQQFRMDDDLGIHFTGRCCQGLERPRTASSPVPSCICYRTRR